MSKWLPIGEDLMVKTDKISEIELDALGDLRVSVDGRSYVVKKKATKKDLQELKKKLEKEK